MKCIYCLDDKPKDYFTKVEHVIPQAFGVFEENFTLTKEVCDKCNQYFGDNLEIVLGRDTIEGINRHIFGIKSAQDFKSLGKKSRFSYKIMEGPFTGAYAYLEYSEDVKNVVIKPLPQVGFVSRATNEYEYFLLDSIPDKKYLDEQKLIHDEGVRSLGVDLNEAREILSRVGIFLDFTNEYKSEDDRYAEWMVEVDGSVDQTICRAIAKIAFNYMTYFHGAEFALQKEFNPIRYYIRRGQQAKRKYVLVRTEKILKDEVAENPRLLHVVTLNWSDNGKAVVSQVSLSNSFFSYAIQLSKSYRNRDYDIRKGHCFNLADHKIYELTAEEKI